MRPKPDRPSVNIDGQRKPGAVAINIRGLPRSLRTDFKVYCAQHGYSQQDALRALLYHAIKQDLRLSDAIKESHYFAYAANRRDPTRPVDDTGRTGGTTGAQA